MAESPIAQESIILDDKYFEHVLSSYRYIVFHDEITTETVKPIIKKLLGFEFMSRNKPSPIMLEINSPGGELCSGFALIDTITSLVCPVWTLIKGEACSMATIVAAMGAKRYATPNAVWMGHYGTTGAIGSVTEAHDRLKFQEQVLWKRLINIYKLRTSLTSQDYIKIRTGELWLTSKQMLQRKIIDSICKC